MEDWLNNAIQWLLATLAMPDVGLTAIFVVSFVSATLLPLGSEPAVFGYLKLAPEMFWPAILVATVGNTLGGGVSYAMGRGAWKVFTDWRARKKTPEQAQAGIDAPQSQAGVVAGQGADAAPAVPHPVAREAVITQDVARVMDDPASVAGRETPRTLDRWQRLARTWMERLGPRALLLSWLPGVGDPLCAAAGWLRFPFWPCMAYMAIGKFLRYLVMTSVLLWTFPNVG